jgi:hypothetical protein
MTKKTYRVVRAHEGDRPYAEGDTREATAAEVKHLVPHVLEPIEPEEKAEADLSNKAEPPMANKADNARSGK